LVLFLHGWEFCIAAMLLSAFFAAPAWAWGACLGWFCHLLLDQKFNRLHPLAYSFGYRAKLRFEAKPLMDWQPWLLAWRHCWQLDCTGGVFVCPSPSQPALLLPSRWCRDLWA